MEGFPRCLSSHRKWQGAQESTTRVQAANDRPLPERALRERAPGTPGPWVPPAQRAIQRRHLVPGAAGSWWALLTENRGPLCGMQSHGRASGLVFGSEKRLCSHRSARSRAARRAGSQALRAALPAAPDSKLAQAQASARAGLGAASAAAPEEPGPDRGWGGWGGSLHRGRRRAAGASPPCSPLGAVRAAPPGRSG